MAKTKISEYDANPANNTDIDGINLAEGMAPGLVNNAIRELMSQLKALQAGTAGDNVTVGGTLDVTGATTLGDTLDVNGNTSITGTLSVSVSATIDGDTVDAFPSGTNMLFQQTTAPTGWTKQTTHNNKALRVVSGTAGSGGSVNFTTAFASKSVTGTVGNTTLTVNQIPSHQHTLRYSNAAGASWALQKGGFTDGYEEDNAVRATGGSQAHNHSFSGTAINLAVQYVDIIIASKD